MSLLEESSQWQRVPESWSDLEDGNYFMYGRILDSYHPGLGDHDDYETVIVKKLGIKCNQISLWDGCFQSHNSIIIEPEYYMKAEEWPKPPEKAGKDEKTG